MANPDRRITRYPLRASLMASIAASLAAGVTLFIIAPLAVGALDATSIAAVVLLSPLFVLVGAVPSAVVLAIAWPIMKALLAWTPLSSRACVWTAAGLLILAVGLTLLLWPDGLRFLAFSTLVLLGAATFAAHAERDRNAAELDFSAPRA
jgi:hypothetical protein